MTTTELATLIAAGTAFGATVLLPVIKNMFGFQSEKLNDDASWRKYLAEELAKRDADITALRLDLKETQKETQKWRDLYYEQLAVNNRQAAEITTLHEDNNDLNQRVQQLQELVAKNAGIVPTKPITSPCLTLRLEPLNLLMCPSVTSHVKPSSSNLILE